MEFLAPMLSHQKQYNINKVNIENINMIVKTKKTNKGMTLIELLVVISIIGVLSAFLLSNLQDARSRARDAERKNDLKQIKTALRMYYNDNQSYPDNTAVAGNMAAACVNGATDCVWGSTLFGTTGGTVYMVLLPQDPLGGGYPYYYNQISSDSFELYSCLENKSDNDKVACPMTTQEYCWDAATCFKVAED